LNTAKYFHIYGHSQVLSTILSAQLALHLISSQKKITPSESEG
jgi:hypothetical protein